MNVSIQVMFQFTYLIFFYYSAIDNDVWMSNSEAIYGSNNNNNNNDDIINSEFHLNDETSKQRVKVRRKKVQGENPIKKYIVRRKNNDFAGPFLTTTTTTESPWVDNQALNRTQEDSRCESHIQLLKIKYRDKIVLTGFDVANDVFNIIW